MWTADTYPCVWASVKFCSREAQGPGGIGLRRWLLSGCLNRQSRKGEPSDGGLRQSMVLMGAFRLSSSAFEPSSASSWTSLALSASSSWRIGAEPDWRESCGAVWGGARGGPSLFAVRKSLTPARAGTQEISAGPPAPIVGRSCVDCD